MKSLVCGVSVLSLLAVAILATTPAGAEDEKTPSIKHVMNKLHKGANSPLGHLKTALKSDSPDWRKVQKSSKQFVALGSTLAKNEPPKGDRAGYEMLANAYHDDAKALDDAAAKEDLAATRSAFGKLSTSCKDCHTAHKGKAGR
jgi:cytochrome c556